MKTNKTSWEDKLSRHLGEDASRFPLPEGHFGSLKDRIMSGKEKAPAHSGKTYKLRSLWLLALPAAAALAFFLINRNTVPVEPTVDPVSLNQAADGLYEQLTKPEPIIELDKEEAATIAESAGFEILQSEVVMEDYLLDGLEEEKDEDPLAALTADDIEEFLMDDLTIMTEL
jgi:hypothetical protein